MADAIRVLQRPFQRPHAAHRTADDRGPRADAEMVGEALRGHPVPTVTTGKSAP